MSSINETLTEQKTFYDYSDKKIFQIQHLNVHTKTKLYKKKS